MGNTSRERITPTRVVSSTGHSSTQVDLTLDVVLATSLDELMLNLTDELSLIVLPMLCSWVCSF